LKKLTLCSLCSLWLIVSVFSVAPSSQGDILEHFKYGALGAEERAGVPYWIWRTLPIVFADKLPKRPGTGWEKLGFIYESAGARSSDRHDQRRRADQARRPQLLRDLSCRDLSRVADRGAPHRARHAGEPDGPAVLPALPDRVRRRTRDSRPRI
jgi:hypothetical protein